MKTKEFIKKVEAMGYKIYETEYKFWVSDDGERTLLTVSKCHQFKAGLNYPDPLTPELFSLAVEYAKTPVDEREEEKKHYIRICDGLLGYLNIDTTTNKMKVSDVYEIYNSYGVSLIKTKFTDKDIEELKLRDDIPLDWKKVKLEEVEQIMC